MAFAVKDAICENLCLILTLSTQYEETNSIMSKMFMCCVAETLSCRSGPLAARLTKLTATCWFDVANSYMLHLQSDRF